MYTLYVPLDGNPLSKKMHYWQYIHAADTENVMLIIFNWSGVPWLVSNFANIYSPSWSCAALSFEIHLLI